MWTFYYYEAMFFKLQLAKQSDVHIFNFDEVIFVYEEQIESLKTSWVTENTSVQTFRTYKTKDYLLLYGSKHSNTKYSLFLHTLVAVYFLRSSLLFTQFYGTV